MRRYLLLGRMQLRDVLEHTERVTGQARHFCDQ